MIQIYTSHPTVKEMDHLIQILQSEELDVRRLSPVSEKSFPSMGEEWLRQQWNLLPSSESKTQAEGLFHFKPIPLKGLMITDPFNMKPVEKKYSLNALVETQIPNIIVARSEHKIIGIGRLLEVEDSIELVSLWTSKEWRNHGIGSKIIDELLKSCVLRPIFSFQTPSLVPFYRKRYEKQGLVSIPLFEELPQALQRDLFYMNVFWGPYCIIKIDTSL